MKQPNSSLGSSLWLKNACQARPAFTPFEAASVTYTSHHFLSFSVLSFRSLYSSKSIRQFYITCPVGIGLGCISKWLGWIPTVAPLRASTSPPPPLAYFQHITLSVPKSKIWYKLNLTTYNSICTCWHYFPKMVMQESKNFIPTVAKKSLDWTA